MNALSVVMVAALVPKFPGGVAVESGCEVSLDVRDGAVRLILRDDGAVFDLSHDTPGVEAIRGVVLGSTLKSLDSRFNYATLGLNRNAFVLRAATSS